MSTLTRKRVLQLAERANNLRAAINEACADLRHDAAAEKSVYGRDKADEALNEMTLARRSVEDALDYLGVAAKSVREGGAS